MRMTASSSPTSTVSPAAAASWTTVPAIGAGRSVFGLVHLDGQHRLTLGDVVALGHEPLGDRALEHRHPELREAGTRRPPSTPPPFRGDDLPGGRHDVLDLRDDLRLERLRVRDVQVGVGDDPRRGAQRVERLRADARDDLRRHRAAAARLVDAHQAPGLAHRRRSSSSSSSGCSVRGSITSADTPAASSCLAAATARRTIAPIATIVTSVPSRTTLPLPERDQVLLLRNLAGHRAERHRQQHQDRVRVADRRLEQALEVRRVGRHDDLDAAGVDHLGVRRVGVLGADRAGRARCWPGSSSAA